MLDGVCRDSVAPQCCDDFPEMNVQRRDCTLMEDPEERLDEETLNGVALRPRVSSEKHTARTEINMFFRYKTFTFTSPQIWLEQEPPHACIQLRCVHVPAQCSR